MGGFENLREKLKSEVGVLLPEQFRYDWDRLDFPTGSFSRYLLEAFTEVVRQREEAAKSLRDALTERSCHCYHWRPLGKTDRVYEKCNRCSVLGLEFGDGDGK